VRKYGLDYNKIAEFIGTDKGPTEIGRLYKENDKIRNEVNAARNKYHMKKTKPVCEEV
jgi:hypothetical protein